MYKGPIDEDNGGQRLNVGGGGMGRARENNGRKMRTTISEQ